MAFENCPSKSYRKSVLVFPKKCSVWQSSFLLHQMVPLFSRRLNPTLIQTSLKNTIQIWTTLTPRYATSDSSKSTLMNYRRPWEITGLIFKRYPCNPSCTAFLWASRSKKKFFFRNFCHKVLAINSLVGPQILSSLNWKTIVIHIQIKLQNKELKLIVVQPQSIICISIKSFTIENNNRISSNKDPRHLLNFETVRCGTYERAALIWGRHLKLGKWTILNVITFVIYSFKIRIIHKFSLSINLI